MQQIKEHPTHTVLGFGMIAIGLWLMANDHFFMWPPEAVGVFNDDVWGALFALDGLGLIIWVVESGKSVKWNRRLLTVTAGLLTFLTTLQFLTWVATGRYMSWISNAIITAFVLILSRGSDTRNE
ncbi:hypothetical protein [Lacticaseibacillus absianus]|uniref:hypothetical protein n=1 Tax=Lacticaseibacillus absianus TaxID=2729623 RepID=UPI0015CE382C|nr:hypothetical protein [Lacticaseibacillus absianus]